LQTRRDRDDARCASPGRGRSQRASVAVAGLRRVAHAVPRSVVIAAALFWIGLAVVAVSYVGYGLWVAWLARVRPRPCRVEYQPPARLPIVTCVMAAANEAALIARKLDALG